jgi:hypothetical protein
LARAHTLAFIPFLFFSWTFDFNICSNIFNLDSAQFCQYPNPQLPKCLHRQSLYNLTLTYKWYLHILAIYLTPVSGCEVVCCSAHDYMDDKMDFWLLVCM